MVTTNYVLPPFRGDLPQIMAWPRFHKITEHGLRAIYEYLSAIPCIEGPATPGDLPSAVQYAFPALHNDCQEPLRGDRYNLKSSRKRSAIPM